MRPIDSFLYMYVIGKPFIILDNELYTVLHVHLCNCYCGAIEMVEMRNFMQLLGLSETYCCAVKLSPNKQWILLHIVLYMMWTCGLYIGMYCIPTIVFNLASDQVMVFYNFSGLMHSYVYFICFIFIGYTADLFHKNA